MKTALTANTSNADNQDFYKNCHVQSIHHMNIQSRAGNE